MRTWTKHLRSSLMLLSLFAVVLVLCVLWQRFTALPLDPVSLKLVDNSESPIARVEPSVVSLLAIRQKGQDTQMSLIGCGVIVDTRGYILTSVDLTEDIESLYAVDWNNTKYEAKIIATDKTTSLTLLKVASTNPTDPQEFQAVRLADFEQIARGDAIIALGSKMTPDGWKLSTKNGRITQKRQTLIIKRPKADMSGPRKIKYRDLLQTDIDLTLENAGAPLVNMDGELVGLALPSVRSPHASSFSYALGVYQVRSFLNRLPIPQWSEGPSDLVCSWLGAETLPLNPVMATHLSLPQRKGEIVNYIRNNSPAEHAGLKRGDVITSVNGTDITDRSVFDSLAPELCQTDKITLSVLRDGQPKDIAVYWNQAMYTQPSSGSLPEVILVLLIFALMYYFVYKNIFDRVVLFVLGAIVVAIAGQHLGFYDQDRMALSLLGKIDVLCLIVGMQLVTGVLAEAGVLEYLAKRITLVTAGNTWRIMWIFCIVTYALSMLVNNLTTIMLLAPMILQLSKYLECDPKPFLTSMIIASNLGGASTMVGDFPNMLIGAETGLGFYDFMRYMLPICLLLLFVMLIYFRFAKSSLFDKLANKKRSMIGGTSQAAKPNEYQDCQQFDTDVPELVDSKVQFLTGIRQSLPKTIKNREALKRGSIILAMVVVGFLLCDFLRCSPAIIALVGGIIALLFGACEPLKLLQRISIRDILFFSGLFVLVGAAEASGALTYLSAAIVGLSYGNILVLCLLLMWSGAFVTCFLNAGPAAAMFLPVVFSFQTAAPHSLYWWSLSLGVCAGSSGTLVGATAGGVTATMVDKFVKKQLANLSLGLNKVVPEALSKPANKDSQRYTRLTFGEYASFGLPIMFIFLLISSIYIAVIYRW